MPLHTFFGSAHIPDLHTIWLYVKSDHVYQTKSVNMTGTTDRKTEVSYKIYENMTWIQQICNKQS